MSKTLQKLLESNIEKAEIVLAIKGEITGKLQRMIEQLSNQKIDVLGPIVDRMKAEHGVEVAEEFKSKISTLLDTAINTVSDVKDAISTEVLTLSGDITAAPGISDLGAGEFDDVDVNAETPNFDIESDAGLPEMDSAELEPIPDAREMKEGAKKLGLVLESTSGRVGTKYFKSKKEMNTWLHENKSKISKVLKKVIK